LTAGRKVKSSALR